MSLCLTSAEGVLSTDLCLQDDSFPVPFNVLDFRGVGTLVVNDKASRIIKFGIFEVDVKAGELRRSGLKVKLQEAAIPSSNLVAGAPGRSYYPRGIAQQQALAGRHLRRLRS
jgi:hypothetical protein